MQKSPEVDKDRNMIFEEQQIGWIPSIIFVAVISVLTLAYFNQWGNNPLPLAAYIISTAVLVFILLSFYKLQAKVSSRKIHLVYGIGIIRIKIEFDKILNAEVAKTSFYQGLGIRTTSDGMLYNIHGTDAVKILYTKGGLTSSVQIGTANPESLRAVLNKLSAVILLTAIMSCNTISAHSISTMML